MLNRKKHSVLFANLGRLEKLLLFHILNNTKDFEIAGIVSDHKPSEIAHFLHYDSNHGKCPFDKISSQDTQKYKKLVFESVNKRIIVDVFTSDILQSSTELKKKKLDFVVDLSSKVKLNTLSKHAKVAKHVLALYQPDFKSSSSCQKLVFHFNHSKFDVDKKIVLVPAIEATNIAILLRSLKERLDIHSCFFDLIRGPNNDLSILDTLPFDKKFLINRSVFNNLVPYSHESVVTTTREMLSSEKITLPLGGQTIYVPATTGGLLSLKLSVKKLFKISEVNDILQKEADAQIGFSREPLVSQDVVSSNYYGVIDKQLTKVLDDKNYQMIILGVWLDTESSTVISCFRTLQFLAGVKKDG